MEEHCGDSLDQVLAHLLQLVVGEERVIEANASPVHDGNELLDLVKGLFYESVADLMQLVLRFIDLHLRLLRGQVLYCVVQAAVLPVLLCLHIRIAMFEAMLELLDLLRGLGLNPANLSGSPVNPHFRMALIFIFIIRISCQTVTNRGHLPEHDSVSNGFNRWHIICHSPHFWAASIEANL